MKWKVKPKPRLGDKRLVTRFAWLPIRAGDEIRWLEWVVICQEYMELVDLGEFPAMPYYVWCNSEFLGGKLD